MSEKIRVDIPIIVEGKYDKNTLLQVLDATVLTTGGFALFNARQRQDLLRRVCATRGAILLTDSDGGGRQIRSFLLEILPRDKVYQLYIPVIAGKESRKRKPSRAGTLGVEGMDAALLRDLFRPFATDTPARDTAPVTKLDFYRDGLSGGQDAAAKRARLARALSLPEDLSANALLEAVNLLAGQEGYRAALAALAPSCDENKT